MASGVRNAGTITLRIDAPSSPLVKPLKCTLLNCTSQYRSTNRRGTPSVFLPQIYTWTSSTDPHRWWWRRSRFFSITATEGWILLYLILTWRGALSFFWWYSTSILSAIWRLFPIRMHTRALSGFSLPKRAKVLIQYIWEQGIGPGWSNRTPTGGKVVDSFIASVMVTLDRNSSYALFGSLFCLPFQPDLPMGHRKSRFAWMSPDLWAFLSCLLMLPLLLLLLDMSFVSWEPRLACRFWTFFFIKWLLRYTTDPYRFLACCNKLFLTFLLTKWIAIGCWVLSSWKLMAARNSSISLSLDAKNSSECL